MWQANQRYTRMEITTAISFLKHFVICSISFFSRIWISKYLFERLHTLAEFSWILWGQGIYFQTRRMFHLSPEYVTKIEISKMRISTMNRASISSRKLTLAPVRTILPETKMSNTIFGCFIRYIKPGNNSGSYYRNQPTSNCIQNRNPLGKRRKKENTYRL